MTNKEDKEFIKITIDIARKARENGNHPFGALLVDEKGNILLKAENTVVTESDSTGHAELNLIRLASKKYAHDFLAKCTLYTSTEPCPMCCGAIFWGNVRSIVFGLSENGLYDIIGDDSEEVFHFPSKDLLKRGKKEIEITGPLLEEDARKVHLNFWDNL